MTPATAREFDVVEEPSLTLRVGGVACIDPMRIARALQWGSRARFYFTAALVRVH